MMKNLTRKSLAFGALVVLSSSALVAGPAQAAATGSVTLIPATGNQTQFNSITLSGITLNSTVAKIYADDSTYLNEHKYLISNPSGAEIVIDPTGVPEFWVYNVATGDTFPTTTAGRTTTLAADGAGTGSPAVTVDSATTITTKATSIVVQANSSPSAASNPILITSTSLIDNVTLTVQPFLDSSNSTAATTAKIDGVNDIAGTAETIVLVAPANVTATTTMASTLVRTDEVLTASVSYSNGINNSMVTAATKLIFFKDGVNIATDDTDNAGGTATADGAEGITDELVAVVASGSPKHVNTGTAYVAGVTVLAAGNYSARAVYVGTNPDIYVGAASPLVNLNNGSNATVDGVKSSVTSTDDVLYAVSGTPEVQVRPGAKAVTISAQAMQSTNKLEASNIQVKAVFTARKLAAGSTISVSATAGSLAAADDVITAYAFTNAKGVASFTATSSTGTRLDAFDVSISVLDVNGVYQADSNSSADVDVVWTLAALTTFTADPGTFVSGTSIAMDFYAKDQFGVGLDSITAGNLSVYAEAFVAGVAKPATYSATVVTVAGKTSFSFANFAAVGQSQQLKATLFAGRTAQSSPAPIFVTVYNTLAISSITVADSFETAITYSDYVEGSTVNAAVSAAVTAAGLDTAAKVEITGTVLNANNAGQPGQAVVLSAEGVLFKAGNVYAADTITAFANEQGLFTVDAFAHMVNVKGIAVAITAGGFSDSTLLQTKLPTSITDANLSFSVSVPANIVKNTTYAIVASLTDKWGNPVAAADSNVGTVGTGDAVTFTGSGSVEINSSSAALQRNFGKDGTVTVFLRSVKDIAGPGALNTALGTGWNYPTTLTGGVSASGTIDAFELVDNSSTVWNETLWSNSLDTAVEILESAADIPAPVSDQKVNVGTFKGYVALYAKGYKGQKMSAIVAGKWIVVASLASDFERVVRFTGAGYTITTKIYIDGVQIGDEFTTVTE